MHTHSSLWSTVAKKIILIAVFSLVTWKGNLQGQQKHPNILWLIAEDMNDWMSCYGDKVLETPTFDRLAANGVMFKRFYTSAPVCSSSRSGIILGSMQTSFGAMHHRSKVRWPEYKHLGQNKLPQGVVPVTKLFQDAGYATFILGKRDFNFVHDEKDLVNVSGWAEASKMGKPWFAQFQLLGGKGGSKYLEKPLRKSPITANQVLCLLIIRIILFSSKW